MFKRLMVFFFLVFLTPFTLAETALLSVTIDVNNKEKLQRGARLFMNYCSGCHTLKYMRYNRMAHDLGLTTFTGEVDKDLLVSNLIFNRAKLYDPIENSMPATDAREWFGRVPPDLSLSARERGPAWIYTYLKSFYADKNRPFGSNNVLVPDVAMPNVLAPLEGTVIVDKPADAMLSPNHLLLVEPGTMTEQQFDSALEDLVTFLVYVAEPVQLIRYRIGVLVILFLGVFLWFACQLKKFYWKNVVK
jgi:ubiquinol-cytochrome c reductase cytochrome c1 subunit